MAYFERGTDDIDEVRAWLNQGSWDTEVLQLSPGPLGYRSQQARLPGLHVLSLHYGRQAIEIREAKRDDWVSFGMVVEASSPMRMDGCEVEVRRLIARTAGDENEFLIAPETCSLNLDVDPELVGGRRGHLGVVSTAEPFRRELSNACRLLFEACRADRPSTPAGSPLVAARARVLGAVRALLAGGLRPEATGATERERFELTQRARRRMQETRGVVPIPELARELAVSERTLFRAFQQCLGMGPWEVEQLRRLHDLRARLLAGGHGRGRVAEAAAEAGFTHLGRVSGLYREHFGERPSETLRRRIRAGASRRDVVTDYESDRVESA